MKEINLYLLAIIASVIIGKVALKIQSDILLLLIVSVFFCTITFILCFAINKEEENEPELTDKIKKERKKFWILEGLAWVVIIADDLFSDPILTAYSSLCMLISLLFWMKFLYLGPSKSLRGKLAWLYYCVMPTAWTAQFVIWIIKAYSPIFSSLVSSSPLAL